MTELYNLNKDADTQLMLDELLASLGKLESMSAMLNIDDLASLNPRLLSVYILTMQGFIHEAQAVGNVLYKKIAEEIWG